MCNWIITEGGILVFLTLYGKICSDTNGMISFYCIKPFVHDLNELIIIFVQCKKLINLTLKPDLNKMYLYEQKLNYI